MPGDDIEPFEIKGNLSIISANDPSEFGDGSVDIAGNINFDGALGENTLANGINIKDLKNLTFKEQSAPSIPVSSEHVFYYDTADSKLKSKENSGNITVYQPTTTKGDLIVHNGTTQIRLPVGSPNQVLVANPSESSGLQWVENSGGTSSDVSVKTILGTLQYTEISPVLYSSYYSPVYNQIAKGPSGNFFFSKSKQGIDGFVIRLNSSPGLSSEEKLKAKWKLNEEPELSKNGANYDGNYSCNLIPTIPLTKTIALSGTSFTTLNSDTTGNFIYLVTNDIEGPNAIYFLTKNIATNGPSITRIANSPGTSDNRIKIRWQASSSVEIQKTNSNDDGTYKYFNYLTDTTKSSVFNVTLSSTTETPLNTTKYQRVSGVVSIKPLVANGPSAIFTFSKNDKTRDFNTTRIVQCSGATSNEKLRLVWDTNDILKLKKNGANYDGNYEVTILI